jgi:hypothetical protein
MCEALSQNEMNTIFHHFTEPIGVERIIASQQWVDTANRTMDTVKNNTIVDLMNAPIRHTPLGTNTVNRSNPSGTLVSAYVLDASSGTDVGYVSDTVKTRVKLATSLPEGLYRAPELFGEVVASLLSRDSLWQGKAPLQKALYDSVYSDASIPPMCEWLTSADGHSVSVIKNGLRLSCSPLREAQSSNTEDHLFGKRILCESVTRSYSQQPMLYTAEFHGLSLHASALPCSTKATGLLIGTLHISGFERPMRSCGVVAQKTIPCHPRLGVHEVDATALMVPYTREHLHKTVHMFCKNAIMFHLLGTNAPVFETSSLQELDDTEVMRQYTDLRQRLTLNQLKTCAQAWGGALTNKALNITCLSGTIDCFKQGDGGSYTDMSLHTRNQVDSYFEIDGDTVSVSSPIVVSFYSRYYHP